MLYSDTPGGNTFTSIQVTRITPAGRILPDSDTPCGILSPEQRSLGLFQRIEYAIFRYSRGKYLHIHSGNQDNSNRQDTARFRYSMWHPFTSAEISRIILKERICYF